MKSIINEQLTISESSPLKARFYDYPHFTYPWHFHSEYEIIYFKEGTGTRFVGNSMEKFSAGDALLIGSNLPHYMKSDEVYHTDDTLRVRGSIIQFEQNFMHHSISHYPHFVKIKNLLQESMQGVYFPAGCSLRLRELLERIPTETGIDQITSFLQLLKEMTEVHPRQVISTSDIVTNTGYDASRIDKILSYLNKHYTRDIDLTEIASIAAMNATAFCRFFKNKTGKSFKNYVLDMRIAYACKLLVMDDINISQISAECGFETISHFNNSFKKHTGCSPSQYRKVMLAD